MSNKDGMLRYKCRMCGEEYESVHVPDVSLAVLHIIHDWPSPWPLSGIWPSLIETHYHKDGTGVADLVGGTCDTDQQPTT